MRGCAAVSAAACVAAGLALTAGVSLAAAPQTIPAGATTSVAMPASNILARCTPPGEFHPNPTKWSVNPPSVTVAGTGTRMPAKGSLLRVTVPKDFPSAYQTISISWWGNTKCVSFNGYVELKVKPPTGLGGPDAKIGPRKYSPLEQLAKTLILDDIECLKAYSDTCTDEEAYLLAAWYVLGPGMLKLGEKVLLKPVWAVIGPELRALLQKYGPQIAAGSETALAALREQLSLLIPKAITRLPADVRLKALDSLLPVLKEMPAQVQKQLVAMRAEAILKPNGKYIGTYDARTGILTVENPAQLAQLYKQLKAGGTPATGGKPYPGSRTTLPGGGSVGLKNKAELPNPKSPDSVGPSIDLNIPGFNVEKIKPATHKT